MAVALLSAAHAGKSRSELVREIRRLEQELESKDRELTLLRKRLLIYRSLDN
jgi:hypothetical protein